MAPRRARRNPRNRSIARPSQEPVANSRYDPPTTSHESSSYHSPFEEEKMWGRRKAHQREFDQQQRIAVKAILSREPEPQEDDPDGTDEIDSISIMVVDQIDILLAERMRLAPLIHPATERSLFALRLKLDLVYWKLFAINDLPPEILGNIFRFAAWSTNKPRLGIRYRLWLTWVCRHWRSVAIADVTLWNAIWVQDFPPYDQALTWVERAGSSPLDVRIGERNQSLAKPDGSPNTTISGQEMSRLLDRLFTKISQIRMLVIVVETWPPALEVLHKLQEVGDSGREIKMERFELHRAGNPYVWIGPGYKPEVHRAPIKLFGNATVHSLKAISLNGINIDWSSLPLSNLTTLDLRRMALEVSPKLPQFRHILRSCPNLYKLAFDGAGPSWKPSDPPVNLEPISLPKLRILVFGNFTLQYSLYVLAQLNAPHVRDLTLLDMTGEDYTPFIIAMTPRFKEIRVLTLFIFETDDTPRNRKAYIKWLESMPLLGYLKISQIKPHLLTPFSELVEDSDAFQSSGTRSNPISISREPLCPKLDTLEFQNMPTGVIVSFGLRRSAIGLSFRKLYINPRWVSTLSAQDQDELRRVFDLYVLTEGGGTPEEAALMQE